MTSSRCPRLQRRAADGLQRPGPGTRSLSRSGARGSTFRRSRSPSVECARSFGSRSSPRLRIRTWRLPGAREATKRIKTYSHPRGKGIARSIHPARVEDGKETAARFVDAEAVHPLSVGGQSGSFTRGSVRYGRVLPEAWRTARRLGWIHPSDVRGRDHLVLKAIDLESGMRNLETVSQPLLDCLHDPRRFLNGRVPRHGEMAGENDEAGGDRPHV